MTRTLAISTATLLLVSSLYAGAALSQDDIFDGAGDLQRAPVTLEFPVVSESTRVGPRGRVFIVVIDTEYDACVEHYQQIYRDGTELGPGWTISGNGFDVGLQAWLFGLLYNDTVLYGFTAFDDPRGCRIEFDASAHTIAGDYYRFAFPELRPYHANPVDPDPREP